MSKAIGEAIILKSHLFRVRVQVQDLKEKVKSSDELIARLQKKLKDVKVSHASKLAKLKYELKTKDKETINKEANAYVQAHSNLLTEMLKRYPNNDFTWLEKLASISGLFNFS
ncbi:hypothetical protein GH714_040352 [Hevea brasiliensis]|uniref:Uncharacterized protein n=1 Tax=Hevea brasiliensis TaxID=3981 RepID=A0A6A6KB82_HEVBR|nr:hypothetical protein GH714_040352 [Hevea brasiliensis]